MQFVSLASGSKGNGYLVRAGGTTVLVDAGLSGREMERRIQEAGLNPSDVNLLLLTHEHADHIRGAGILSRRFNWPVYATEGTLSTPCGQIKPVGENAHLAQVFPAGDTLTVGALTITSFSISHDASDPVGYVFRANGHRLALAADLGQATRLVLQRMTDVDALILESNHCPEMLRNGHYPLWLQRRIRGTQGHLSNEEAGEVVRRVHHGGLRYLVLAHLSENNNSPQRAYSLMRATLDELGAACDLRVGMQHRIGNWIDLDEE